MRFKLTFLLILLNALVFFTIVQMDKHADSLQAAKEQSMLILPPGSVERAISLSLEGPGVPASWSLRKSERTWRMEKPQHWPVNSFAVENILDQLRFLNMETAFPVADMGRSGTTLADYGLQPPSATLKIVEEDGTETTLGIGAVTQMGSRLYMLSPDKERVFVTSRKILTSLLVGLDELRTIDVFNLPAYTVSSISVQRADGVRTRLSRAANAWSFESPIRVKADSEAVNALLADLTKLELVEFVSQDPAAQGLLSPQMRIGLEAADKRQSLLIGSQSAEGLLYAKLEDSPEVFTISQDLLSRMARVQEELRERHFNSFKSSALGEIQISMSEESATLQKLETGQWQVVSENQNDEIQTLDADTQIVDDLIDTLSNLSAIRFVSDAPSEADLSSYGFDDPQRVVTMKFKDGSVRQLILGGIGNDARSVYARLGSEPFVYEITSSNLAALRPVPLHYRSRLLETLPPAARLISLKLKDLIEDGVILEIQPAEGQDWSEALETLMKENSAAASTLLNFIRAANAQDFVTNSFSKDGVRISSNETRPWAYELEAIIELPTGASESERRSLSYSFTKPLGGTTQIGGSSALGLTFTLGQDLMDALHELCTMPKPPARVEIPGVAPQGEPLPENDAGALGSSAKLQETASESIKPHEAQAPKEEDENAEPTATQTGPDTPPAEQRESEPLQ